MKRYCAFVDILGFSDLIDGLREEPTKFLKIRELLKRIHEPHDRRFAGTGDNDFQAQSISDAVALSTRLTVTGLSILIDTLEHLSLSLLQQGYFVRGALCRGLLYHDSSMVFGDALVRAYRLESEVARYPRIVLTKAVYDDAMASNLKSYCSDHIRQAEDGPYFIHILSDLRSLLEIIRTRHMESEEPIGW